MANFGRKMWAWKHSLKGIANTEAEPQMIFPPGVVRANEGTQSGNYYSAERWYQGGGYNPDAVDKNLTGFLYAKKVTKVLGAEPNTSTYEYPCIDVTGLASDEPKFSYVRTSSASYVRTRLSWDLQNAVYDKYNQTYHPEDWYSTLAVSSIVSYESVWVNKTTTDWDQTGFKTAYTGFTPFWPAVGNNTDGMLVISPNATETANWVKPSLLDVHYNTFKNVSGTNSLACMHEVAQIKGPGFNWNEYEGGTPDFDLWGRSQYTVDAANPADNANRKLLSQLYDKQFVTFNGNYPVYSKLNEIKLVHQYAGKTVKKVDPDDSRYAGAGNGPLVSLSGVTGWVPDDSATIDIAFEVELALQRHGVSTHEKDIVTAIGGDDSDEFTTKKLLSYVSGNAVFLKGDNNYEAGSYLLVPVYYKLRAIGTEYQEVGSIIHTNNNNVSIRGNRPHTYKYGVVAIRLEKNWNVGSVIHGSGRVLDWETEYPTYKESYPISSGIGRGSREYNDYYGDSTTRNPTIDNWEEPYPRVESRNNAEFVGDASSLNGVVNPVMCLRMSESGKYGFYSGGTVFENAPVGAGRVQWQSNNSQSPQEFGYNGNWLYMYDSNSSERNVKIYYLTRSYDLSSINQSNVYEWDWQASLGSTYAPDYYGYRGLMNGGLPLEGGDPSKLYVAWAAGGTPNQTNIVKLDCTFQDGRPDLGTTIDAAYPMNTGSSSVYGSRTYTSPGSLKLRDQGRKVLFKTGATGTWNGPTNSPDYGRDIVCHTLPDQYDFSEIGTSSASFTRVNLNQLSYIRNYDEYWYRIDCAGYDISDDGLYLTIQLYRAANQYANWPEGPPQSRVNEIVVYRLSTAWDLSSTLTRQTSRGYTWPNPYFNEYPAFFRYKPGGSAFYMNWSAPTRQLVGYDLGTNYDPSDQQPISLEDSKYVITRFGAPYTGTDNSYADNYFFHVTDTPQNNVNNGYTGRDPFPSTGLSTVINSIDFRGNFPYAPGYDSTNYPRHDVSGGFIRSFRLSNDGRFLYILWVTDTMIPNSSSASIQQWVERYFINHPEGCDGDDAWRKGSTTTYIQQNGVYFSGTTDIYNIQGDSSGGYLSSATAIDVTPDGLHLQVLQSEAHKAGKTNYKPMIVEHYLGGNDLGLFEFEYTAPNSSVPNRMTASTNPRKPLRGADDDGTNGLDYHWPRVPCKPGLFAEAGVNDSDANYGNGGSNCAVVFDRTYLGGAEYWRNHRIYMQDDTAYEEYDTSSITIPSNYDVIPSDFSWNTEGTVLYMYGSYMKNNGQSFNNSIGERTFGCQRLAGSPYVISVPINLSDKFIACGQQNAPQYDVNYRSPKGSSFMFLYSNRIRGVINEHLASTSSVPGPWVPGTLYRTYMLPVDEKVYHRASTGFGNYEPWDYNETPIYMKIKYAYDATDGHRIVLDDVDPANINGNALSYHNFNVKKSWWNKSVIEAPFNNQNITTDYRKAPHGTIVYVFDISDPSVTTRPVIDTLDPDNSGYDWSNFSYFAQGTPGTAGALMWFFCPRDMTTIGGYSRPADTENQIDFMMYHPTNLANGASFTPKAKGGIRFVGNARDYLEIVAAPLFHSIKGVNSGDIGNTTSHLRYDVYTAGSTWQYPTKIWIPPANISAFNANSDYDAERLAATTHSPMNLINRSVSPPTNKSMSTMNQTYPLASVFAHHKGGRYLYYVSENTNVDAVDDPNHASGTDRYRPLRLSIIPIETNIEDSISGNTQYSRGYNTYWGQPPDGGSQNTYPYNYKGWGLVLNDEHRSVDGPRMATSNRGDWGAIHLSTGRNDNDFFLSMSSRWSPDSNTHWSNPFWTQPNFSEKDFQRRAMGLDSYTLTGKAGVYYTSYYGKGFANYDYLGTNSKVEGVATVLGLASPRHPLHIYKADTGLKYWYGKDLRAGRWGLFYYTVDSSVPDYIQPYRGFSWGLNNTQTLDPGDSPFNNAGFIQNNWFAQGGADDALDIPKLIVSNPTLYSVGAYSERPEYISVMQQMPEQAAPYGPLPPPTGLVDTYVGQTYITKQTIYNVRSHTKLGKAYKDGGKKTRTIPYEWTATNSYTLDAEAYYGLQSNSAVSYLNPVSNATSFNVPKVMSFRFASKGKYLLVLLSGRTTNINGQSASHAAFSVIKYELETPYDVVSTISANTQYFTYYENTNLLGQTYDFWWASIAQPNCYFGADFYVNDDGTKLWVIGLNSNATAFGFAYPTESRTLLREFTLSSGFDFSSISDSGFATYDTQSAASNQALYEVPVSLEVSPDGNNVYWSRQYMSRIPSQAAHGLGISGGNNYGNFSGVLNPPDYNSLPDDSNLRHFRSTLPQPYNLKQPDQFTTESARNKNNQSVTRTVVGVPWYATEGAAQRVRFSKNYPNRLFRSNLASQKADISLTTPNQGNRAQYYNQVLNQAVGGFSSITLTPDDHKVQKVDGTWNIGNAGMFRSNFTTSAFDGDGPARQEHCAQDMFLFEVNDEENVVLLCDTQLRIFSFLLNNSTKGY